MAVQFWKRPLYLKFCAFLFWLMLINLGVQKWSAGLVNSRRENLLQRVDSSGAQSRIPRYDLSTGENLSEYLRYIPRSADNKLIILCGMSQMYAINEQKPGDQTVSEWLDDILAPKRSRVFGLAAPNLCNEEALFLLLTLIADKQTKPAVFIYGLCFDKFRNIDLRPGLRQVLESRPDLARKWENIAKSNGLSYSQASEKMQSTLKKVYDAVTKPDGLLEEDLRGALSYSIPIIGNRRELNAWIQYQLYTLRNDIFHIKTDSKRPRIKSRYSLNQQFLELLIDVGKEAGVLPILYIVPINPLAADPYVPSEYEEFKAWISMLAKLKGIPYENMEDAIPTEEWGEVMGEPDYKHFKGEGHRHLAEEIARRFSRYLSEDPSVTQR